MLKGYNVWTDSILTDIGKGPIITSLLAVLKHLSIGFVLLYKVIDVKKMS